MGTTVGMTHPKGASYCLQGSATGFHEAETINLKSSRESANLVRFGVLLLAICSLACERQNGISAQTPALAQVPARDQATALKNAIASRGIGPVFADMTAGNGAEWKAVMSAVETGSPEWLSIAAKLLSVVDAGTTSDLYFALSLALIKNPEGVLSLVGPDLPLENLCSVPFIEPDRKTVVSHQRAVRAALLKVTAPGLASRKVACEAAIAR